MKGLSTITTRKKKASTKNSTFTKFKYKRPALKNSAFTKFKYVTEGRYIRDEKSLSFVPRTRVQQCARSGVNVPSRAAAPLWRVGYAECCGQEKLLCDGGSVASTVESPDWCNASAVCKASMLCCCSTAVDSSPCMCEWHLCFE